MADEDETDDDFIEYFRARHDWWCKPGSAIHKDLTAFAIEHEGSPDSPDELYRIFCTLHGIKMKPEKSGSPMPAN